jgi:hypothetical protein
MELVSSAQNRSVHVKQSRIRGPTHMLSTLARPFGLLISVLLGVLLDQLAQFSNTFHNPCEGLYGAVVYFLSPLFARRHVLLKMDIIITAL